MCSSNFLRPQSFRKYIVFSVDTLDLYDAIVSGNFKCNFTSACPGASKKKKQKPKLKLKSLGADCIHNVL